MTGRSSSTLRVLLLTPPGMEEERLRSAKSDVRSALRKAGRGEVEVVGSDVWYADRFPSCGTLESWALDAVTGKRYADRQPHFHGFVLFGGVEKGSAAVASSALAIGMSVLLLSEQQLFHVTAVREDGDGWSLQTSKERPRV